MLRTRCGTQGFAESAPVCTVELMIVFLLNHYMSISVLSIFALLKRMLFFISLSSF